MNRPMTIKLATVLLLLGAAAAAVSVSLNIVNAPPTYSRQFMVGYGVVRVAMVLLMIYMLYLGKNWARIVYAVLGVLSLAAGFSGPNPAGVHHEFVALNHWFGLVITAVVLVMLFLPPSNRWFALGKAHEA